MNTYKVLKEKRQQEVNSFPIAFAFSDQQFDEGMRKLGLNPTDTDKVYSIGGGGFIRKTDSNALHEMFERHEREIQEAIAADITGEGFIFDMFNYELDNHEYVITYDVTDTLEALGLTVDDINNNPLLAKGLELARKAQFDNL